MLEGSVLFLRLWLIGLIVCPISRVWKIILSVYGRKFFLLQMTLPLHSNIEIIFPRLKKKSLGKAQAFVCICCSGLVYVKFSGIWDIKRSALAWSIVKWKLLSHVRLSATPWTVHGILQARILEWVAFPFSRGSSQPTTQVSRIAGRLFTSRATREAQEHWSG